MMDANRETKVWQRVTAPPGPDPNREGLRLLAMGAAERVQIFQAMTVKVPRSRDGLGLIREMAQANLACIKGMLLFHGQQIPTAGRSTPLSPARQGLIRSYYLAKKAAAEYTARSVDPEFGVVFQEMASREMKICTLITQLLGEN